MNFTCELVTCTSTLLREVAEPRLKRKDIAMTYMLAMRSSEPTDWAKVNAAIIARWSMSGLIFIKTTAHGLLSDRKASRMAQRAAGSLFAEAQP